MCCNACHFESLDSVSEAQGGGGWTCACGGCTDICVRFMRRQAMARFNNLAHFHLKT